MKDYESKKKGKTDNREDKLDKLMNKKNLKLDKTAGLNISKKIKK